MSYLPGDAVTYWPDRGPNAGVPIPATVLGAGHRGRVVVELVNSRGQTVTLHVRPGIDVTEGHTDQLGLPL